MFQQMGKKLDSLFNLRRVGMLRFDLHRKAC